MNYLSYNLLVHLNPYRTRSKRIKTLLSEIKVKEKRQADLPLILPETRTMQAL